VALLEEPLLPLLLLLLVFLVPVAAYCLVLAMVNRRLNPVMVSGPWDTAGLLFAASGCLLFVGPALIAFLYHQSVGDLRVEGRGRVPFADLAALWWRIWLVYYVAVIGGAIGLLWLRRGKTIVYNIDPADFERTLGQLMDRLGLEWNRLGNRVFVGTGRVARPSEAITVLSPHPFAAEPLAPAPEEAVPLPPRPAGEGVFDIEPFGALCHVTLHWRRHRGLIRAELEAELARALADVPAPDNPAGSWFFGVAGFLLAVIFLGIFIIFLNRFLPRG
jgi:hypothetical protein